MSAGETFTLDALIERLVSIRDGGHQLPGVHGGTQVVVDGCVHLAFGADLTYVGEADGEPLVPGARVRPDQWETCLHIEITH